MKFSTIGELVHSAAGHHKDASCGRSHLVLKFDGNTVTHLPPETRVSSFNLARKAEFSPNSVISFQRYELFLGSKGLLKLATFVVFFKKKKKKT
jgi:hypothetical protein